MKELLLGKGTKAQPLKKGRTESRESGRGNPARLKHREIFRYSALHHLTLSGEIILPGTLLPSIVPVLIHLKRKTQGNNITSFISGDLGPALCTTASRLGS